MKIICQQCGPVILVKGKTFDVTCKSWPDFISHVVQLHPNNQHLSIRIEKDDHAQAEVRV